MRFRPPELFSIGETRKPDVIAKVFEVLDAYVEAPGRPFSEDLTVDLILLHRCGRPYNLSHRLARQYFWLENLIGPDNS